MSCNFWLILNNPLKRKNKNVYTSFYYLLPSSTLGTSPKKGFQKVRIEKFAPKASKRLQNVFFTTKRNFRFCGIYFCVLQQMTISVHKKWSFPLRISSINVTKSIGNCGFTEEILNEKLHFLSSIYCGI